MDVDGHLVELREQGYCVLKGLLSVESVEDARRAFWSVLTDYLAAHSDTSNHGPHRHFVAMPFEPPVFAPEFFFDPKVLRIVRGVLDERMVADQWGCDVPVLGSEFQEAHVDYARPLFPEAPDLRLPWYMVVVSFGLARIDEEDGAIEIAAGTHSMMRAEAERAVACGEIPLRAVPLEVGDMLIRHPWKFHRGTPNRTKTPRALVTIRYVRRWYEDRSREALAIPLKVWESLAAEQRTLLRFRVEDDR